MEETMSFPNSYPENLNYHPNYSKLISLTVPSILNEDCYENKLNSIDTFLKSCTIKVNFWGTREIVSIGSAPQVEGFIENLKSLPITPVALDTVAQRTLHADKEILNYNAQERKEIILKLKEFYDRYDEKVANSNWITWIFFMIREHLAFGSSTRQVIDQECKKLESPFFQIIDVEEIDFESDEGCNTV
jgi:hypothetical protein